MSLRLRITLAFAVVALLPTLPVTWVVRDLLDRSFSVALSPSFQAGLEAGAEASRGWLRAERRDFQRDVTALWETRTKPAPGGGLALLRVSADGADAVIAGEWSQDHRVGMINAARTLAPAGSPAPGGPLYPASPGRETLDAALPLGNPVNGWLLVSRPLPAGLPEAFADVVAARQLQAGLQLERERLRRGFLRPFLLVYGLVLLISLLLAALMGRRFSRRVTALADGARRVGAGDWDARVPAEGRDEIARLGAAFNEMAAGLAAQQQRLADLQRLAAWREMARSLAHEIKNPLTPISLMVQEMRDRYPGGDADYAAFLTESGRIVEDEVESLRRLSREFSAFARTPDMQREVADLGALLGDLVRLYGGSAKVALEVDPTLRPFLFDPEQLRRVFSNLFENALGAMAELPEASRYVQVSARVEAGRARVDVTDTGPGVPEALRARIFEPHFSSKAGGMGLGLALVRSVCTLHGGDARLEPSEAGAHFVVELPLDKEDA